MPRIIADLRNPEEKGRWQSERALRALRRRKPENLVDALDKITARCISRLHQAARAGEIRATGLVDGVLADLEPKAWFGEGRSRFDFKRQRIIRADGKEAVGVEFTIGTGSVPLAPDKALAWIVGDAEWGLLGHLAETVLGRLRREALGAETGERGAALARCWLLLDEDEQVAMRLAAQEAFEKEEPHASVDPPAEIAEKEPSKTATLCSVATGSRQTTAEPQRGRRAPQSPRRGPRPGTTNRVQREREALIPTLQAARQPRETFRRTIERLEEEGQLKLPGAGDRDYMIDALARVWGVEKDKGL